MRGIKLVNQENADLIIDVDKIQSVCEYKHIDSEEPCMWDVNSIITCDGGYTYAVKENVKNVLKIIMWSGDKTIDHMNDMPDVYEDIKAALEKYADKIDPPKDEYERGMLAGLRRARTLFVCGYDYINRFDLWEDEEDDE